MPNLNCRVRDLICPMDKSLLPLAALNRKLGVNISASAYFKLHANVVRIRNIHGSPNILPPVFDISFFFNKNPSSKMLRRIIFNQPSAQLLTLSTSYRNFNEISPSNFNERQSRFFYAQWNFSWLPSEFKNFTLKRVNAKIILNNQLAHFTEASPFCSFCNLFPSYIIPKETHAHFFFNCRFVNPIVVKYFSNFYGEHIDLESVFFKGHISENNIEISILNLEVSLFTHSILRAKVRKKIPQYGSIRCAMAMVKKSLYSTSPQYRKMINWIKNNKVGRVIDHINFMETMPHII